MEVKVAVRKREGEQGENITMGQAWALDVWLRQL